MLWTLLLSMTAYALAAEYDEHVGKVWGASMFGCFNWRSKVEIQQACDAEDRCAGYTMSKGDWAKKQAVYDVQPDTIYGESFVPGCLIVHTDGHPTKEHENTLYYTKEGHVVAQEDVNHLWSGFEVTRMDRLHTNEDTITFDVNWRYDEDGTCPGCMEQLYIGFEGEVATCIYTGNPDAGDWAWDDRSDLQTDTVTLNVPENGGDLVACGSWQYECQDDVVCKIKVGHVARGEGGDSDTDIQPGEKVPGEAPADSKTWLFCKELGGSKKQSCQAVPGCKWRKKECIQDRKFMKAKKKACKKVKKDADACKKLLGCIVVKRQNGKIKKCTVDNGDTSG